MLLKCCDSREYVHESGQSHSPSKPNVLSSVHITLHFAYNEIHERPNSKDKKNVFDAGKIIILRLTAISFLANLITVISFSLYVLHRSTHSVKRKWNQNRIFNAFNFIELLVL